ncbi:MAG TPA: protease pro-enzyme activation domain-containing protein [Edaphobacter sp.]|jgi:kumamolisin
MRRLGVFSLAPVAILFVVTINAHAQSMMTHHVRDLNRDGRVQAMGHLPVNQMMTLNIVLPLRDPAGLQSLLSEIYNPASPSYRHFLTVPEFTARFGPTQEEYDEVVLFAKMNGFTIIGGSRDGMDVQIKGPVSAVESAFHVSIGTYKHPTESRTFYAPDREPTTYLPFKLWHISGLDNFSLPHPMVVKKSDYAKALGIAADSVVSHATTGSGPSASFLGSDMRAAYYGGSDLTGAGQNLGLLEFFGTDLDDVNTYFNNVGQTNNVPISLLSTDGTSTSCLHTPALGNCDDTEQTLDITQAIGMAPGLSSLVVYVGSTDTAIISAMTTHDPLPTTIGCSWGWTPVDPNTLDPYFQKMAVQGQSFFAASGDNSTWSRGNEPWPADNAYVTSVGGTDLITAGQAGPWQSETAWLYSGGGISPDNIAIPSWQQLPGVINANNRGSTTLRNGPDVSANADFTFYTCANQSGCLANQYGGTSFGAPMWAGYIALVNQQLANNGNSPIGFINPTIYSQNVTSSYDLDFHDITSGTSGSFSAVSGYDLVTGWGSPNTGLINALTGSATQTPAFTLAASPTALSVPAGGSAPSTITTAISGGFNSAVALAASGVPAGVTVGFAPASIAAPGSGKSTVTFTVSSTTTPGTYSITITGTGGNLTQTATISLTVTAAAPSGFTVSASSASLTVARGTSGSATIATAVSGSFNSTIALSASGQGNGQTVTFSPSSIAAPGSGTSTMTVNVGRKASIGNHTITITAAGGAMTQRTTVTLNVTR